MSGASSMILIAKKSLKCIILCGGLCTLYNVSELHVKDEV